MSDGPGRGCGRFVEAAGLRWHVQQSGSGPSLLLIHGTGASTHSWRDVLPLLADHYAVLAVDLPGHGLTGAVSGADCSIRGMSNALAALLRVLDVRPDFCVGHSAGAVILCQMALDGHVDPQLIVSLNGAFMPLPGVAGRVFAPIARAMGGSSFLTGLLARQAGNRASVARVIGGTGSRIDTHGMDLYARLVSDPKHLAGALCMMGNWDLHAFERELPRLGVPLVLVVADNDLMVPPAQAERVRQRVPNASVLRVPGLGHLAHEEAPLLIVQHVLALCGTYAPRKAMTVS